MKHATDTYIIWATILASVGILLFGMWFVLRPAPTYSRDVLIPQNTATIGASDAPVFLVEFSDFQCPACAAFRHTVDALIAKYPDTLQFAYRHFPLPQHAQAQIAAYAFEAAHAQKKGWQMYEYLFAHQTNISESGIFEAAQNIQLDMEQFKRDMDSQTVKDRVARDLQDGARFGVNATPTFFLNGEKLRLISAEDLTRQVDEAMSTHR
jgi:protein-disulfide isomerase